MADGIPFGPYRLQRRLARGGMAEVFLARHLGFERRVAIKRILPHLSDSDELRSMFLDEARLAAQLTHPNVVHIYEFGRVSEYDFIAMEFVDGVDLGQLIFRGRKHPVPFELAARIFSEVCSALFYAHRISDAGGRPLGLVHRDVSPQNVLVSYDGVVKLVDFGIAKAAFAAGRTRPGVVKGKYAYMSPEQVEGRSLDARSDIFSAGICLYELVTGVPLFRRDDATASMREIRDGKPIVPERFRPDVPPALIAIMRRALARNRDDRYPDAASMQLDLERYLKSAETIATSTELGAYLRREIPPGEPIERQEASGTERQDAADTERQSLADSEAITLEEADSEEGIDTDEHEGATRVRRPPVEERPFFGTSLVAPLPHPNRRAYVAVAVAAFTVAAVGLLALRPGKAPTIAVEPPEPIVHELAPVALDTVSHGRAPRPTGTLTVRTVPWSKVYDGARLLGTTPLTGVALWAGPHTLKFVNPQLAPRKRNVVVGAGEELRLSLELK